MWTPTHTTRMCLRGVAVCGGLLIYSPIRAIVRSEALTVKTTSGMQSEFQFIAKERCFVSGSNQGSVAHTRVPALEPSYQSEASSCWNRFHLDVLSSGKRKSSFPSMQAHPVRLCALTCLGKVPHIEAMVRCLQTFRV